MHALHGSPYTYMSIPIYMQPIDLAIPTLLYMPIYLYSFSFGYLVSPYSYLYIECSLPI